jgi:hypothetical protein
MEGVVFLFLLYIAISFTFALLALFYVFFFITLFSKNIYFLFIFLHKRLGSSVVARCPNTLYVCRCCQNGLVLLLDAFLWALVDMVVQTPVHYVSLFFFHFLLKGSSMVLNMLFPYIWKVKFIIKHSFFFSPNNRSPA